MKGLVIGERVVVYVSWQKLDGGGSPTRPLIEGTIVSTTTTDDEQLQYLIRSEEKREGIRLIHNRWVFPVRLRGRVWFKIPGGEGVTVMYR